MKYLYNIIFVFIFLASWVNAQDNKLLPFTYPYGTVSNKPYFIWYDVYNERDKTNKVIYKLSVSDAEKNVRTKIFNPISHEGDFYYYRYPEDLPSGKYSYKIERLLDNRPVKSKYYYAKKYPIEGKFKVKNNQNEVDNLTPQTLIFYISEQKKNKILNLNNTYFYGGVAAGSFGIGMLFLSVLDFGIISKVIAGIAFTASAFGVGASGYYSYHYFNTENHLDKILEQEKNIADNWLKYDFTCKFEIKF